MARTSALLALATLLSRLLGLVREMLVARYYGASGATDSFAFAIVVPELLRTLIISGAVASVFIPIMTATQKAGKPEEAKKLAGFMITFISLIAIIVIAAGEIFAPQLVQFSEILRFSPGSLDPEKAALTAQLIRILLPIVFFVGLWGLMGGILNTFNNFHVPGLAPLAWNGTIIIILIIFGSRGLIYHVAWAFMIGHAIQMLVHLPALMKLGIHPTAIDWKHPMLHEFIKLAPVAVLAYAATAVNSFIGQGIALSMEESAASSIMYAFRIQQLPLSIFGVSVAVAIFPTLSRQADAGNNKEIIHTLANGLRMIAIAVLPAVVFFLILPVQTIELVYQRGAFTSANTMSVASALYWYTYSILPLSLMLLTIRTFFSHKDPKTPAILGLFTIAAFYFLVIPLTRIYGFTGIPMSHSIVAWIFLVISMIIINTRYGNSASLFGSFGLKPTLQMLAAGAVEAIALYFFTTLVGEVHGSLPLLGFVAVAMLIGGGVYLGVLKLLGSRDLTSTLGYLVRRR